MSGACSTRGDMRNAYNILVGKLKGKRLLGRHRHRRGNNIRMDHRTAQHKRGVLNHNSNFMSCSKPYVP